MEEGIKRVNAWVIQAEQMIEQNVPLEAFIPAMMQGLPQEAIEGFVNYPIEAVIGEVKGYVQTRGIIDSPQGIAYLKQVQVVLRQNAQPAG